MSSNVAQSYPYASETEAQRAAAVERVAAGTDGLRERITAEAVGLGPPELGQRWWVWVCPADDAKGRLHVAGYARDSHAVYAVCDSCGRTFLR